MKDTRSWGDALYDMGERMRPNVIIVAVIIAVLIDRFGERLIDRLPEEVGPSVLTGLIGVGIGGLIAAMMRMFESPSVPADVHERMIKDAMRRLDD